VDQRKAHVSGSVFLAGTMKWEDAVRWCMNEPSMKQLAADAYFDDPAAAAQRFHASAEYAEVRKLLPQTPGRALDLGAGNGILSYALARDGWQVTAVEPDPSALVGADAIRAIAASTGVPIKVIEAFGEAIPLEDANFDVVVARQVLHHAHDLDAFCAEMARLVRKGGKVLTFRDHVVSGPEQLEAFFKGHPLHHLYGGENAFTRAQYRSALEGAGLRIEAEFGSFSSPINYAPHTRATLRGEIAGRTGPLRPLASAVLSAPMAMDLALRLLSAIDRRPGRLVSFAGVKP
jgi:SAM-dependent methyltransferase